MSNVDPISSVMAPNAIGRERSDSYHRKLPRQEGSSASSSTIVIDLNDDSSSSNKVSLTRHYSAKANHVQYQKAQQNAKRLAQLPPHLQMYEVVSMLGEDDTLDSTGRVLNRYL